MIIFSLLLFLLTLFFFIYLPGRYILRTVNFQSIHFPLIVALTIGVGISAYLFFLYVLSWVSLPYIYFLLVIPIIFFELPKTLREYRKKVILKSFFSLSALTIFIGAITMTFITWGSGVESHGTLLFFGGNAVDGIFHLSVIGSLRTHFPSDLPGLSGITLRGYHFLYDFLIATFASVFHFSVLDLTFRFFPFFISFFYGFCGLAFAKTRRINETATSAFIFLLYFAQSFQYFLLHPFGSRDLLYDPGIVQGIANIINPSVILAVPLIFLIAILIGEKNKKTLLLISLILGVLIGIKIYAAILIFAALIILAILRIIKHKDFHLLFVVFLSIAISAIIYIPLNFGSGGLIFTPLLLYRHFMESDRAFGFQWGLKYLIFLAHNNYVKIVYLYVVALFFFYIPTMGVRLFLLLSIPSLLKKSFYSETNIFFLVCIIFAIVLSSFFIQTTDVFNIVQFVWFAYILLLFPTSITLIKLSGRQSLIRTFLLFVFLVVLGVPSTIGFIKNFTEKPTVVDSNLVFVAKQIQETLSKKDSIMVINRERGENLYRGSLISALIQHPVFYEEMITSFLHTESIITQRRQVVDNVSRYLSCSTGDISKVYQILLANHIKYLLLLSRDVCIGTGQGIKKIFNKGKYSEYIVGTIL